MYTKSSLALIFDKLLEEFLENGILNTLNKHKISKTLFYSYLEGDPSAEDKYSRALRHRTELLVDETITISDTEPDPHKARVRIDTRRWYASKMAPAKYADRLDVNVNTTVDIKGALAEARSRMLHPRFTPSNQITQRVDIIEQLPIAAPDKQSGEGSTDIDNVNDLL